MPKENEQGRDGMNRTQIPTENVELQDGVDGVMLESAPAGLSADNGDIVGGGEENPREPTPKPRTVTGEGIREVDVNQFRGDAGPAVDAAKAGARAARTKDAGPAAENKGA